MVSSVLLPVYDCAFMWLSIHYSVVSLFLTVLSLLLLLRIPVYYCALLSIGLSSYCHALPSTT